MNGTARPCLDAALELLGLGYWPVAIYPAAVIIGRRMMKGKEPIGSSWGAERWSESKLRRTFAANPGAGVGICFGPGRAPGGRWLLDLEGDGPRAADSLAIVLGADRDLGTPSWNSRRGTHNLFGLDEDDASRLLHNLSAAGARECRGVGAGVWHLVQLPDLEWRVGGYKDDGAVKQLQSVVPPTAGEDGVSRAWRRGPDMPVATLPGRAFDVLADLEGAVRRRARPDGAPAAAATHRRDRVDAYAIGALEDECNAVENTPQGSRNDRLNEAAFKLGTLVGAGVLSRPEAEDALAAAARRAGLGEAEIRATIRSGLDDGEKRPRDLSGVGSNGRSHGWPPGENGQRAREAATNDREVKDERPEIVISHEEHRNVDEAVAALKAAPLLFQRGGALVTILADCKPTPKRHDPTRPPGSLRIALLPNAQIRRLLTVHARWMESRKGGLVTAHPPASIVDELATLGAWPEIRPIEGITETPTLRPDGSLIGSPGYDEETGLWFAPNGKFPAIPDRPTLADAQLARDGLYEVVEDFPFAGPEHKATWLAALLTPLARWAIDGPCPMFLFDGNCSGTGKTKLCDIVAILATGREMPRGDYPADQDEMQKMLLSVAMAADRLILFDNVPTGFNIGGSALDRALTARTMKGRILGKTQMTPELSVDVVFYATGNNLGLQGDSLRRVAPCRLETEEQHPEEREDFKIGKGCPCGCKGDLLAHVKRIRGPLVSAALTILRAYVVAGRPDQRLTPMDYGAWCGLIRNAVKWVTGVDPCEGRRELVANDEETNVSRGLVTAWKALCLAEAKGGSMSVAEALAILEKDPDRHPELRAIFSAWSKDGRPPPSRVIGHRFKKIRGRNIGGRKLDCSFSAGIRKWFVSEVGATDPQPDGAFGADGASPNPSAGEARGANSSRERTAAEAPKPPKTPGIDFRVNDWDAF
jgi:hypothetical protein